MNIEKRKKMRFKSYGAGRSLRMVVDDEMYYRNMGAPNTLIVEFFRRINEENVRLLLKNVRTPRNVNMGQYVKIQFKTPEDCRQAEEMLQNLKFEKGEARISHPVLIREKKRTLNFGGSEDSGASKKQDTKKDVANPDDADNINMDDSEDEENEDDDIEDEENEDDQ